VFFVESKIKKEKEMGGWRKENRSSGHKLNITDRFTNGFNR